MIGLNFTSPQSPDASRFGSFGVKVIMRFGVTTDELWSIASRLSTQLPSNVRD